MHFFGRLSSIKNGLIHWFFLQARLHAHLIANKMFQHHRHWGFNGYVQSPQTAWLQTKRTYTCISVFSHTSSHSASVLSSRVKNTVIPCPIFLVISAITSWYNLLRPLNSWDICNKIIVISFTHQRMNSDIPNFLIRTFMLLFATHKTNIRWGKEAPQKQIKLGWHQFWWKTSWVMQFS